MDLTRRGLLGRAALAASSGLLLAPRVVFAGGSGEAVFEARLPASGRLVTQRTFELAGIDAVDAEVRARGLDGRWSDWMHLHPGHESSSLSDPVWVGPSNALEVRSRHSLRGARVVLVDAGRPVSAAAARTFVDADLTAAAGQPPIIARSSWATSACKPRVPAVFGAVNVAFVHHTVNSNSYRASQSAAMVRAICLFHKYGNGWNDIGYNFVVDRFGQVFEGRAGGIDETIAGAQAGGYNFNSTGVALLGNFAQTGPTRKMFVALANLLAWKLTIHSVPAVGRTTVAVSRAGAPYSRYRAGTPVSLNRISGHRDGDATSCPGNGMYRQLPRLRQVVNRLVTDVGSLSMQIQGAAPGSVTVGGVLADASGAIAGATVEIQSRSTSRGPATLASTSTSADGTWSVQVPLSANANVRAVFRGDGVHPAVVSPGLVATVPPQLMLTAASQFTTAGGVIAFTGTTAPAKPQVSIVISQQQPDGTLTPVRTIRVNTADDGSFSRSIGFPDLGQFQVIAHTPADAQNALGTSAPITITVA